MSEDRGVEKVACFLLGAVAGAATALLFAPESGVRTRRRIRRTAEDAADYIVDASKDLADNCEDVYRRSAALAKDGSRELTRKYKDLYERSRELVDETAALVRS